MPEPPDQAARDRIANDLGSTLFVEAGAGSGKSTALVDRVVALVTTGAAELQNIAAITFTEKAGAELRDRVRRCLEEEALKTQDPEVAQRCREALDQLDASAIGTLHAFAQRLLSEHPVEAGLPPRVEVLDEVESGLEFDRRWTAFRDGLLDDPALRRTILLLIASGVHHNALKVLAVAFDDNWNLVEERVPAQQPEPPFVRPLLDQALTYLRQVCDLVCECTDPTDRLCVRLGQFLDHVERLAAIDDELDLLEALGDNPSINLPSFKVGNIGKKGCWNVDLDDLKARISEAGDALDEVQGSVAQACVKKIGSEVRRFTLQAAGERRAAGRLEFHDLLVLARSLLRSPQHGATVRSRLHQQYRRLLLDEFQDTDPIQIELAVRIAAENPESQSVGERPWNKVPVAPGHLFVVGDPKQSIYRFRRANIDTFLQARDRFGPDGGGVVELTVNFRTGEPVISWVNQTFDRLMSEPPDVETPTQSQPEYLALQAVRDEPPSGPSVAIVCRHPFPKKTNAGELRAEEAQQVAATVSTALGQGWAVDDGNSGWRPARLGDITILIPARTSLPFLEEALEAEGIPYRAESSSLIYASRAVRDLLMVLRAVDDPTNYLHIVSALRTPLFGCGDDDLFRFKVERSGRWSYLADQPESVPEGDPVRAGLCYLRELYEMRHWQAPSELLDRIARDRRALELGFVEGRPRDVWRRLRFVIDQARGWSESAGGSLRQYLHWVESQSAEGARVQEAILPETDDDAVRIMTIHAAKGLEFAITIVSGMSTVPQSRWAAAEVVFPPEGEPGYKFGKHVQTVEYTEWAPIDEQMGYDERIRLLYVACTRAKDHLVVSLCRKERAAPPEYLSKRTSAELLKDGMGNLFDQLPDAPVVGTAPFVAPVPVAAEPLMAQDLWKSERFAALATASRPTAVAATALRDSDVVPDSTVDPGLRKRPRDMDLPPWLKGRYGTAVGRAVHGVLQTIDLATGVGLEAAVAAQCEAEAVPSRAGDVRRLVEFALGSPSVQEAAGSAHWREVYACVPVEGGHLLEGYVDLLYRGPGGLVVVDYKTASSSNPEDLDRRLEGYRLQGASYALAIGISTGEPVSRVTFVFLTPEGAVERSVGDLSGSIEIVVSVI